MKKIAYKVVLFLLCFSTLLNGNAFANDFNNVNETNGNADETRTFYVDATNGNDSNDGRSEQTPWKSLEKVNASTFSPGDRILLKSGERWKGSLHPLGSGTQGKPIVLDMYGTGAKPLIEGQGVPYVIGLYNQEHWSIGNIEITNSTSEQGTDVRSGVEIIGEDYKAGGTTDLENIAVLSGIHLHNLYIHDINGLHKKGVYGSGGINVLVRRNQEAKPHRVTKFDGVLIENNKIENVTRTGIMVNSAWNHREQQGGPVVDPTIPWTPATNVVIRGNEVLHVSGDGIVPHITTHALVEYNRVHGYNEKKVDYNAGMWTYNGDYTVYQFNEVSGGKTIKDGMSFDYDNGTKGIIFQYNYSHDNEGGTVLICQNEQNGSVSDGIFRYNISQNDHYQTITVCSGSNYENMQFYNNVFYVGPGINNTMLIDDNGNAPAGDGEAIFKNNIFYNLGTGGYQKKATWTYDSNVFYGNNIPTSSIIPDSKMITANPEFINPGKSTGLDDLAGYQLKAYSPAINTGAVLFENGGRDYWGNPLYFEAPDRGAFELQAMKEAPPVNDDLNNLAFGKSPISGSYIQNSLLATDGMSNDPTQTTALDKGLQYIQFDLGGTFTLNRMKLWHYFGTARTYKDVVVQVSNTPDFSSGVTTVFNNDNDNSAGFGVGTDSEYVETAVGKEIIFQPVEGRYVRFWSNGNNHNAFNHYVEVKVYGMSMTPTNVALGKTSVSGGILQNPARITDGLSNNSSQFAGLGQGLQYLKLDLGDIYELNSIKLWHFYGDGRTYKDVIVQISNTADFSSGVTTVFNNDLDNSAKQGIGTDSEYAEAATGKIMNFEPVQGRYVRLWSNGSYGNVWNHYVEVEVYGLPVDVDLTAPVTIDNAAAGWKNQPQTVILTATDEGKGVEQTFYSLDNGPFYVGSIIAISEEGVHSLRYFSTDKNGNREGVKSTEVKIDLTGPEITSKGTLQVLQTESAVIDFAVTDNLSGVEEFSIKMDGQILEAKTTLDPLTLAAGKHVISVRAVDKAGNVTTTEFILDVGVHISLLDDVLTMGFEKGFIDQNGILNSLLVKVRKAQEGYTNQSSFLNTLNSLENEIHAQSGKHIHESFAALLLDDLLFIKEQN
ncbi:discoidin domain-containing protein [Neobacillus niacini]|uniref:OmpL47-type beta-barrel domain-containing protein n=1 Tax=Neobacillus niacini TaxID=86668 RepID=UPI0012FB0D39|nr:discoidin domain-containing protein [Neobacillus niacini]MEC1523730.1 discoidin domain-containing protein [Neobacillus niacini]